MNSPGQRFADDFESDELRPLVPVFMRGAYIVYAHTVLQGHAGMGYLSPWAEAQFNDAGAKNAFYEHFGRRCPPGGEANLAAVGERSRPDALLDQVAAPGRDQSKP
jgi:hypothetical protein